VTQGASLDSELNGPALNPVHRTQPKRSSQKILGHLCADFNWVWTRPIFSESRKKRIRHLTQWVCRQSAWL